MPIKLANTFNPRTELGRGLANIAAAMYSNEPTDAELADAEAKRSYMHALTSQSYQQQEKTAREIAQMDRQKQARDSIAGAFGQMQQLAQQTADMGVDDPGLASVVSGMPTAVAKYGIQGGLDPRQLGPMAYMGMSQYMDEGQMRRMLPALGKVPTEKTAITPEMAMQLQGAKTQRALAQQQSANQAAMQRQMAMPTTVAGPGGAPQMVTRQQALAEAMTPYYKPAAPARPLTVGGAQYDDMLDVLDQLRGVVYDAEGNVTGGERLDPQVEQEILLEASKKYQAGPTRGNLPLAVKEALSEADLSAQAAPGDAGGEGSIAGSIGRLMFGTNIIDVAKSTYESFFGDDKGIDNSRAAAALGQTETKAAQQPQGGGAPMEYRDPDTGVRWIRVGDDPNDPKSWVRADA